MRRFMERWNLKRLPSASGDRRIESTEGLGHWVGVGLARAVIEKGRYQSHRRGHLPSFGLVTIKDRMRGEIYFKHKGTVEEAKKVFDSAEFRADLDRMVYGEDHITPAANGQGGSFCKTQFANDPRLGGWENFVKAHLSVLAILEKMQDLGFELRVVDEGGFWEKRDLSALAKGLGQYDAIVAAGAGMLKDIASESGQSVESPMSGRPDFEHLEAKGQESLGDQLKMLVKALAKKNPPGEHRAR
jgi:hypothetical protein